MSRSFVVLLLGLQGCVGRVVGEVEEEKKIAVGFEDLHRFVRAVVRHVLVGSKAGAFVLAYRKGKGRLSELIDRVEILLGIDYVGVVGMQIHLPAGSEPEEFIKALVVWFGGRKHEGPVCRL